MQSWDMAVNENEDRALFVDKDGAARIYRLGSDYAQLCGFPLLWDNGGRRVALNKTGSICVSGTYHKGGVAGFASESGEELWRRSELSRVQDVLFDGSENMFFVRREGKPSFIIDGKTGETISKLRALDDAYAMPGTRIRLVGIHQKWQYGHRMKRRYEIRDRETSKVLNIILTDHPLLSACATCSVLVAAEMGGSLRAVDVQSGDEIWSRNENRAHYLVF